MEVRIATQISGRRAFYTEGRASRKSTGGQCGCGDGGDEVIE